MQPKDAAPTAVAAGDEGDEIGALKRQLDEAHAVMWALYKELDDKNASLQRSNDELDQFATIAGHDLQEPLRKVIAHARMLDDDYGETLDAAAGEHIRRMRRASERMLELLGDLVRYARVTSAAKAFEPTSLGEAAGAVLSDLEDQISREGGAVDVGPLPTIEADPIQIRQLLQNLISNGLKFHRPGRPPKVRVRCAARGGGMVALEVSDEGIGFKTKFAERVFQPFRRLHGKGRYDGTGMGLAIVKKIAERHGGAVEAISEPGRGSTFVVFLPSRQQRRLGRAGAPGGEDEG